MIQYGKQEQGEHTIHDHALHPLGKELSLCVRMHVCGRDHKPLWQSWEIYGSFLRMFLNALNT